MIAELTTKIEYCRTKLTSRNREIYEAMKQISQIKLSMKKVEQKTNELSTKMSDIKHILESDVDLPGQRTRR